MRKMSQHIYNKVQLWWKDVPGWLDKLRYFGFSPEEIQKIEDEDKEEMITCEEAEEDWRGKIMPQVRTELKERIELSPATWRREKRLEFLKVELKKLYQEFIENEKIYSNTTKKDFPYWLKTTLMELRQNEELYELQKKYQMEIYILEHPEVLKNCNWVTPEQIARALDFPFDQLIQFNQAGFAFCPFHDEKVPSFHFFKKANRGHCFSCQWSGNAIDLLRKRDSLSFQEAVRALN